MKTGILSFIFLVLLPSASRADSADAIVSFRQVNYDELTGIQVPVGYPDNRTESHSEWEALWNTLPPSDERDSYRQEYRFVDGASMRARFGLFPDSFLLLDWRNFGVPVKLAKASVSQPALFQWGCDERKVPILRLQVSGAAYWQPAEWSAIAIDVPATWPLPKADWMPIDALPLVIAASAEYKNFRKRVLGEQTASGEIALQLTWSQPYREVWIIKVGSQSDSDSLLFDITGENTLRSLPLGRFWQGRC